MSVDESDPSPDKNEATVPTQAADLMVSIMYFFILCFNYIFYYIIPWACFALIYMIFFVMLGLV